MSYLVVKDLQKRYGSGEAGVLALRGISFQVEAGEFLAVHGASGCGKSTLLHILGAMDRPTQGEVWLNGRRLDSLNLNQLAQVRRRHIGFVFQAFNLLPTLTAIENVCLPLTLDGAKELTARKGAEEALADVGLAHRADHYPSQLSGGEMQRVAIARALAIQPDLLIADEPTGSLDSDNGQRVLELMAELNQSKNLTILMATHAPEAAAYASRTLGVRDGQLEHLGSTNALPSTV